MENILHLLNLARITNLADQMTDDELTKLGARVVKDFETDKASRADWEKRSEKAMDMALQVNGKRPKTIGEFSADVVMPFLTVAALQFHARAYPAVTNNGKVVKGKVTGEDSTGEKQQRAERVAKHLNYQITEQMPEWEEQMDALLLALPIEGCEFKKTYYDPVKGRNVSEWIRPANFVVNYSTKTLEDCPRATHVLPDVYPHIINERMRAGIWRTVDLHIDNEDDAEERAQCILEQHRLEDLDGDGIKEPYIVTVHKESKQVLRVKARWEPTGIIVNSGESVHPAFVQDGAAIAPHEQLHPGCELVKIVGEQYFTKYSFIPSPDGGFYDVGFGQLIGPMSEAVDSIINRLLDSGTLANLPMGFISENLKLANQAQGTGVTQFKPGELKKVKANTAGGIAESIYTFDFPEPSVVLFQLLGFVADQMTSITAVKDIMTGQQAGQNTPVGTTMALIEQGMKVFTAIYLRIYRALNKELARMKALNAVYLSPKEYFTVVDSPAPIEIQIYDYQGDKTDIQPVADPGMATTMQRMARAQFAAQLAANNPHINAAEATRMMLEAGELPVERLFIEQPQTGPDPKLLEMQAKMEKMAAETQEIYARIAEMAQRLDLDAVKEQTAQIKVFLDAVQKLGVPANGEDFGGRMGEMEAPTGDAGVLPPAAGDEAAMLGVPGAGPV